MTRDLSNIYHRPGELFWLECDPFQRATPCFEWQIREPFRLHCPNCQSIQVTVPTEGVSGQALRTCLNCEHDFVKDWTHIRLGED